MSTGAGGFLQRYEGMIGRLERRFTRGLYFLASFTYGRAMDLSSGAALDGCNYCGTQEAIQNSYNLKAQYGPSDSNVTRRFVFSGNWDVPFGPGKRHVNSGVASHILRGWQASAIWTAQDGSPFTLKLSQDNANVGNASWPNRVCSGRLDHPAVQRWYDASCFPAPPAFIYGNSGRNILYGPGMDNTDFALHRFFSIPRREGMKLEFRGELFNLFNRTNFGGVNGTVGNANFGRPTGPQNGPRVITMGLRLDF